jgi:hypothetical protein
MNGLLLTSALFLAIPIRGGLAWSVEGRAPSALKAASSNARGRKAADKSRDNGSESRPQAYSRKINFIYRPDKEVNSALNGRTPSPAGWEAYDGSIYTPERGYGWLTEMRGYGRDRGTQGIVILPDGTQTSPEVLNRPELANFAGRHPENRPLIFRIDLPDGWYRIACASIDPDTTRRKPLVDQRSFKCRAHDVVFAGAAHGAPTAVGGRDLVEGSGIVEVTDGHLRVVVGDPAYAGWVWAHPGPLDKGWRRWWYDASRYANGWYQVLSRTVDPGFHSLSLNALQIDRVAAPKTNSQLIFRDFFNREDSSDVNTGVPLAKRWLKHKLHPRVPDYMDADLYKTSARLGAPKLGLSVAGWLQQQASPATGIVRYSTRVSLFTGEGSQKHSGEQEAGIVLLADPSRTSEFTSTFVGIRFVGRPAAARGRLIYRVGDGGKNYRTKLEAADANLPFKIAEGEFEIIVDHDVAKNVLRRIQVNGADVTDHFPLAARLQRVSRGLFGIRSAIQNTNPDVRLRQFYWYYRVEALSENQVKD